MKTCTACGHQTENDTGLCGPCTVVSDLGWVVVTSERYYPTVTYHTTEEDARRDYEWETKDERRNGSPVFMARVVQVEGNPLDA